MDLHNLEKIKLNNNAKIIGRGRGTGKGGHTVGRGTKGQKARRGKKHVLGFEGGQSPLYKKLPQIGGFKNMLSKEVAVVSLDTLNRLKEGEVTPEVLVKGKIISKLPLGGVKILSGGELKKILTLKGFKYSEKAKKKIEQAGSKINA